VGGFFIFFWEKYYLGWLVGQPYVSTVIELRCVKAGVKGLIYFPNSDGYQPFKAKLLGNVLY